MIDGLNLLNRVPRCRLDQVCGLRNTNRCKFNSSPLFDLLKGKLMLHGPKSDAGSCLSSSSCTSRPMDVGFNFFRRLQLDDKINIRNIETS